ncbi:MAG: HepT-like ribonuclease domain-containing protein [Thermoplasmata archaeon]
MRDDALRVADILEALERIRGFVSGGRSAFFGDSKTQAAVAYEVLKMGEAANGTSAGFQKAHAAVPWRRLIALRNEIVHESFRVDLDALWEFIESELPGVERALRTL